MTSVTLPYPQLGFIPFNKNAITSQYYPQRLHFSSRFANLYDVTGKPRKIPVVRASSGTVIDKEQDFKPSFDEYLKAMETVKSRREKRKTVTETPPPPSPSPSPLTAGEIDEEIVKKVGTLGQDEVKKKWVRKKLDFKEPQVAAKVKDLSGVGKNVEFQDFDMNLEQNEVKKKWVKKKMDFKEPQVAAKVRDVNNGIGKNVEFQDFDMNLKKDEVMKKWVKKKLDTKEAKMDVKFQEQRFKGSEMSSVTSRNYVMSKEKGFNLKKLSGKSDLNSYDNVEIERAAFKSLEESPDVCDQPRVSRVDMDERIQKLAKCLNGASIDSPEWNFSKMMRSAKIRFADFSIIRLIQILGNYGNWRQVLQVIEWMQARERFKSNRIRNIYTAALDVLGKARRPVEALNVFHTMQQQMPSYTDRVAYLCIVVTLGQAGHMRVFFHVIDSLIP